MDWVYCNKRIRTAAFTLVELLVVIAIISVLASLLLPVLSRAKAAAQATKCLNNLKRWGEAGLLYIHDNDDALPLESSSTNGSANPESWPSVTAAPDAWYNALSATPFFSSNVGPERFYRDAFLHCPAARFPKDPGNPPPLFSLAMNSKLIMPETAGPDLTIRAETIQRPDNTPFFLEGRVDVAEYNVGGLQTTSKLGQPAVYATRFAARHNRRGNMVFFDGHVEKVRGEDVVETRDGLPVGQARFPDGAVTWCADPLFDPNN